MKPAPPVTTIMAAKAAATARRPRPGDTSSCNTGTSASPGGLDRQENLRMGVPQVHARQRAMQRQLGTRDFVDALGIRRRQTLLHPAVTFPHRALSLSTRRAIIPGGAGPIRLRRRRNPRQIPPTSSRTAANSSAGTTRPPSSSASSCTRCRRARYASLSFAQRSGTRARRARGLPVGECCPGTRRARGIPLECANTQ